MLSLLSQPFFARIATTLSTSLPALSAFELSGVHWVFRPNSGSAADGSAVGSGKEWVSPPVTPRPADAEVVDIQDWDFEFNEAFMEWAY